MPLNSRRCRNGSGYRRAVGAENTPVAEVDVSVELVRRLLGDQHPDLAGLPLAELANGWDNVLFRLGDELVVRMPRRTAAAELVRHEQRWLSHLAPRLPLPVPAPVRIGRPGAGYPWTWSIVPLLPGDIAARTPPANLAAAADQLGRFVGALHAPAPTEHPVSLVRGVPLAARDAATRARLERLVGTIDHAAALRCWEDALAAPPWTDAPRWLHGDLHPANVLVCDGRISAVIDFGDITAGDPATDLAVAWMLFPATEHPAFRAGYQASNDRALDEHTWTRARGWAIALSLAFLAHSADNPLMGGIGQRALDAALRSSAARPT